MQKIKGGWGGMEYRKSKNWLSKLFPKIWYVNYKERDTQAQIWRDEEHVLTCFQDSRQQINAFGFLYWKANNLNKT